MVDKPVLRVAIVGGGIGGLILAVALRKLCGERVHVDLYEAAHAFSEIGAGIGVWPRVWATMEALGLADDLSAIATGNDGQELQMRRSDKPMNGNFASEPLLDIWLKMGGIRTFHRADFQAVVTSHLPPTPLYATHFNKRLASYAPTQNDPNTVTLTFADGTNATCDLLVGCDGIKSVVRGVLYRDSSTPVDPVWSGSVAYRSLIPQEVLKKANPEHPSLTKGMMCCGASKHVVAFPIANRKFVNIVAFITKPEGEGTKYEGAWMREASKQEVQDAYTGWDPLVMQLIDSIDKASLWAINTIPPLPTYVGERVVLLGDAAHAMNPHQGSGAGQAIEDSFVLASLLADPRVTRKTLPEVLQIYDSIRRPVSQEVARRSRDNGQIFDCLLSPSDVGIDAPETTGDPLADDLVRRSAAAQQLLLWAKETTIMDDRDKALQALDTTLGPLDP